MIKLFLCSHMDFRLYLHKSQAITVLQLFLQQCLRKESIICRHYPESSYNPDSIKYSIEKATFQLNYMHTLI